MEWQDEGLILSVRRHGERDVILETMTRGHGRHLGLVRGGRSARQAPGLQPGNRVALTWRARLEEHLGQFTAEPVQSRAGLVLSDPLALHAVMHLASLLRLMPERQVHAGLYEAADGLCQLLAEPLLLGAVMVRFEITILAELGFGLDLSACAATGRTEGLTHVSPKSGRAVSAGAAEPYRDRLLPLPAFLLDEGLTGADSGAIEAGFRLAGYFLGRHLFGPRGIDATATRQPFLMVLRERLAISSNISKI
ncbi:MAG: DNA repair protein RecO [Beijerinckiaceae bacterium]|nr:DNA repair protein RecO [Beijerinckiaceae bacterium]